MLLKNGDTDSVTIVARNFSGDGATGASILLAIQDSDTGLFYTGAGFGAFTEFPMVALDATNLPGHYKYDFTPPVDNIRVRYSARSITPEVANGPWEGEAQFGDWIQDVITARKYIRNRMQFTGNRYTLYEDDKITPFEEGDITSNSREPD